MRSVSIMMWKRIISFAVMMGLLCPLVWAEPENKDNTQFRLYDFSCFIADPRKEDKLEAEKVYADLEKGIDLYCEDIPKAFDLILKLNHEEKPEYIQRNNEIKIDNERISDFIKEDTDGNYVEILIQIKVKKPNDKENVNKLLEEWSLEERDVGYSFPSDNYTIWVWRGRIYDDNDKGKLELHLCAACQIDKEGMHGMENSGDNTYFISNKCIDWKRGNPARIKLAACLELKEKFDKDENDCWLIDDKDVERVSLRYNKDEADSIQKDRAREADAKAAFNLGKGTEKPNEVDGSSEGENSIPVSSETAVEVNTEGIMSDADAENSEGDLETSNNIPTSGEIAVEAKTEGIVSDAGAENPKGDLETSNDIPTSGEIAVEAKTEEIMSDAGAENSKGDLETSNDIPTSGEIAVEAKTEEIMSDAGAENSEGDLETSNNIPTSGEIAVEAKTEEIVSDAGAENSKDDLETSNDIPTSSEIAVEAKTEEIMSDAGAENSRGDLETSNNIPTSAETAVEAKTEDKPSDVGGGDSEVGSTVKPIELDGEIEQALEVDFTAPSIVEVKPEDSPHVISKGDDRFDVFGDGDTVKLIITANDEFDKVLVNDKTVKEGNDGKSCVIELQPSEDEYVLCIEDENGNRSDPWPLTLHRVSKLTLDKCEEKTVLSPDSQKDLSAEGNKDAEYAVKGGMALFRNGKQVGYRYIDIVNKEKRWFWKPNGEKLKQITKAGADEVRFQVWYVDAKDQCIEGNWEVDYQAPTLSVDQKTFTVLPGDSVKVKIECDDSNAEISNEQGIPAGEDSTFVLKPAEDNTTYRFFAVDEHGNKSTHLELTVVWVPETEIEDIEVNSTEVTLGPKNAEVNLEGHAHPDWQVIVSGDGFTDTIDVDKDGNWDYDMDGSKLNGGEPKHGDEYKLRLSYPEAYPGKKQEVLLHWDAECELHVDPIMEGATSITGKTDPGAEISLSGWDGMVKAIEDDGTFRIELTQPAKVGKNKISAVDACGNEGEEEVTVNKAEGDQIPEITIKATVDKDRLLTIQGTADKDYTVVLSINNKEVEIEKQDNGRFEKSYKCPKDGQYTVTARYDGYFSDYEETTDMIVDTTAPEIELDSTEIEATTTEFLVRLSEEYSEPVMLRAKLDENEFLEVKLESGQNEYTIPLDPDKLTDKEKLVITAMDAKDNTQSYTVEIKPVEKPTSVPSENDQPPISGIVTMKPEEQEPEVTEPVEQEAVEPEPTPQPTPAPERLRGYILQTALFGVLTILFGVLFLYSNKQYQRMRNAQIDRKSGASHMTMRSDRNGKI